MLNEEQALSITALNEFVKCLVETSDYLQRLRVRGEISNLKLSGGHYYFSLKDDRSAVAAVMFRTDISRLKFTPENGMNVIVSARATVYSPQGRYQLVVSSMSPDGVGALYEKYEKLKNKLAAEGLFDEAIKKPLPLFPKRIGIVTSPNGAAVHDIINISGRRYPMCELVIFPAQVQGNGAEKTLIDGIRYFGNGGVDAVIIGRGGGSIEDLWCFNSEELAREIRKSRVPVVSAVGHETDFTICDFASDRRAPTPSAAAEILLPDGGELYDRLLNYERQMRSYIGDRLKYLRETVGKLASKRVLKSPDVYLCDRRQDLAGISERLERAVLNQLERKRKDLTHRADVLDAVSPLRILSKGYTLVSKNGDAVRSIKSINAGDEISLVLADGFADARIESLREKDGI